MIYRFHQILETRLSISALQKFLLISRKILKVPPQSLYNDESTKDKYHPIPTWRLSSRQSRRNLRRPR